MSLFGFGKRKMEPFRIPREITALRTRIDAELRENFPNLERCKQLARETRPAFGMLKTIIAEKEYAEEAARIRDDIQEKFARLEKKINKNRQTAENDEKEDSGKKPG